MTPSLLNWAIVVLLSERRRYRERGRDSPLCAAFQKLQSELPTDSGWSQSGPQLDETAQREPAEEKGRVVIPGAGRGRGSVKGPEQGPTRQDDSPDRTPSGRKGLESVRGHGQLQRQVRQGLERFSSTEVPGAIPQGRAPTRGGD